MVWWGGSPRLEPVVEARSHTQVCDNCNNSAEHTLHRVKTGAGFGNPITGKMWVSTRTEWVLVCVICEAGFPVTKEVAQDLKSGAYTATRPSVAGTSQFCDSCGAEHSDAARFCGSCGTAIR